MLATVVDVGALVKILIAVLIVGVGVTAIFGEGALSAQRLATARRERRTGAVVANGLMVVAAGLVCLGALVAGFLAMTHK